MKVELPGESKSFADITAGECFAFTRKQVTELLQSRPRDGRGLKVGNDEV
jgi:hypothetical protein